MAGPDHAVDILSAATSPAHDVLTVVAGPALEPRRLPASHVSMLPQFLE
jgi:hypothetical protein